VLFAGVPLHLLDQRVFNRLGFFIDEIEFLSLLERGLLFTRDCPTVRNVTGKPVPRIKKSSRAHVGNCK